MPPIRVHHTETSDRSWDGPANEARLRTDEEPEYYRQAYAWQDPEGNPRTKAAYKFIHHFVDSSGNIGAASIRACITGIAVLNGARGGTTIPDEDRRGVYNHLAAHIRDAGLEPPALRMDNVDYDVRTLSNAELRAELMDDGPSRIVGYAVVWDSLSEDIGGFRERFQRGAFRLEEVDVRALWNHERMFVLGRTTNGTLRLEDDEHGLRVEIYPPDTSWARDAMVSIARGDVSGMSFGFRVPDGGDRWTVEDDVPVRVVERAELIEVSPVTFPAYTATSVAVRSALQHVIERMAGSSQGDDPAQDGGQGSTYIGMYLELLDVLEEL